VALPGVSAAGPSPVDGRSITLQARRAARRLPCIRAARAGTQRSPRRVSYVG
jgi:hypothetical protein